MSKKTLAVVASVAALVALTVGGLTIRADEFTDEDAKR